jgi:hypothetical protein
LAGWRRETREEIDLSRNPSINQRRPPMEIGERLGLVFPAVSSRITEIWGF